MGMTPPEPGNGRALGVLLAIFDFPLLVTGYRRLIDAQPDMAVVGALDERTGLRDQVARTAADVVITECMPYAVAGCASFQAVEEIRSAKPGLKILAIDCRCGSDQFSLAIKAGADGFVTREAQAADIVDAVHRIARGETYVSPAIVTRMVNTYVLHGPAAAPDDPYETLSERSREVLRLAAYGHTNREIARTLHLSEQTVHSHRASIMEKLGFHDRVELLRYALRRGVIQATEL
jgi:DNA-binding NarL/FixJ family response regulator